MKAWVIRVLTLESLDRYMREYLGALSMYHVSRVSAEDAVGHRDATAQRPHRGPHEPQRHVRNRRHACILKQHPCSAWSTSQMCVFANPHRVSRLILVFTRLQGRKAPHVHGEPSPYSLSAVHRMAWDGRPGVLRMWCRLLLFRLPCGTSRGAGGLYWESVCASSGKPLESCSSCSLATVCRSRWTSSPAWCVACWAAVTSSAAASAPALRSLADFFKDALVSCPGFSPPLFSRHLAYPWWPLRTLFGFLCLPMLCAAGWTSRYRVRGCPCSCVALRSPNVVI